MATAATKKTHCLTESKNTASPSLLLSDVSPSHSPPVPAGEGAAPAATEQFDLHDSQWFLNRELTWLSFNRRVLHEAADERTPLLERLKFIAIVSSNLDEFFMKRIGGLKQQIGAGVRELTLDGRTARQQVSECYQEVRSLEADKEQLDRKSVV